MNAQREKELSFSYTIEVIDVIQTYKCFFRDNFQGRVSIMAQVLTRMMIL